MSNYNFIEKFLHSFYLSNKFIKKTSFDVEKFFFLNKNNHLSSNKHVFITGMPRSGTTVLLNYFFKSRLFASLTYSDMPMVLCPNIWGKINSLFNNIRAVERSHGDNILFSTDSEEAFEEVFWETFNDYSDDQKYKEYINYIFMIMRKYKKDRYLCKNNLLYKRINFLKPIFPKSFFLIPFRLPLQQSYSLLNQHIRYRKIHKHDKFVMKYMDFLGHNEFGMNYIPWNEPKKYKNTLNLNHWLEQWLLFYTDILNLSYSNNLIIISYESLCMNSNTIKRLSDRLEVSLGKYFFKLSNRKVKHDYDKILLDKCELVLSKLLERSL